ncbi:hypothetical protein [Leptothermofonsia sp. ETS-13]|uniref:hypothetical protein n=1 Tax=Leptothermofonsia sp. ETS-13 TaxID=3035696 RepID=UPI003B9DF4B2
MPGTVSAIARGGIALFTNRCLVIVLALLALVGCSTPPSEAPIELKLYQAWELQPGDSVGGRLVLGGLGDITIALEGNPAYAPFDGRVQMDRKHCLIFSSPDVPAYLFRLCGLDNPRLGRVNRGDVLGKGRSLEFATLRKQPNGTWAIVEPTKEILERTLTRP